VFPLGLGFCRSCISRIGCFCGVFRLFSNVDILYVFSAAVQLSLPLLNFDNALSSLKGRLGTLCNLRMVLEYHQKKRDSRIADPVIVSKTLLFLSFHPTP
jgi:hypothetical protein